MTEEDLSIPSNRIRFAIVAMKEFEARDGCEIDMYRWRWKRDGVCYACCAGAAFLKLTGLVPSFQESDWINKGGHERFELSLNRARLGEIYEMFQYMDLTGGDGAAFNTTVCDYETNPDQFYADMETLADDLEEAGY